MAARCLLKAFLSTINTVEKSPWAGRSQPAVTHADIILPKKCIMPVKKDVELGHKVP